MESIRKQGQLVAGLYVTITGAAIPDD